MSEHDEHDEHDDTSSASREDTHAMGTRENEHNARNNGQVVNAISVSDDEQARTGKRRGTSISEDEEATGATSTPTSYIDKRTTITGISAAGGAMPAYPRGVPAPEHAGKTGGEESSMFRDANGSVSLEPAGASIPHSAFPPPPEDLNDNGREFWRSMSRYEFRPDEMQLLAEFARTVDDLAIMRAALAASGTLVEGSKGQPRPNPLLAEMRGCRQLLIRLAYQLGIPDDESQPLATPQSRRNARAANARWRAVWQGQEAQHD